MIQAADLLMKILQRRNLSQAELAEHLAIAPSQITRYLAGEREPNAITCLLLMGLSDSEEEKRFWLKASGLSHSHLTKLASSLKLSPQANISGQEQDLLDWWRDPKFDAVGKSVKDLVEQWLKVRTTKKKL